MYAQALNAKDLTPLAAEDPVKLASFQARIDAEEKIEPNDWMPEQYRRTLDPPDFAARPLGNHRHAAGGQLGDARADAQAQGATPS